MEDIVLLGSRASFLVCSFFGGSQRQAYGRVFGEIFHKSLVPAFDGISGSRMPCKTYFVRVEFKNEVVTVDSLFYLGGDE